MPRVEIRAEGQLDPRWAEWLNGLTLSYPDPNETLISGEVRDQAALYGLIAKLRDLGVKLLSVGYEAQSDDEPVC